MPQCYDTTHSHQLCTILILLRRAVRTVRDAHDLLGADKVVRVVGVRNATADAGTVVLDQRRRQRRIADGQTVDQRQARPVDGRQQVDGALDAIDAAHNACESIAKGLVSWL